MTSSPLLPAAVSAPARPRGRVPWTFGSATIRLLLFGFLFLFPAWFDRRLIVVMGVWDLAVLIAWAIDLGRLPPPGAITVTRSWASPPALGAPQEITLTLANGSGVAISAVVSDFVSPLLRASPPELTAAIRGGGVASVSYEVTPRSRGDLELSFAALRYRGASALAERWAIAPLSQTIRIYPDMGEAARERIALVRARQIAMEKRRARQFGLGREFESLREFRDGDELRDVCWTATARRGRLVTRTYRPERSQTMWIVIDTGRLMRAREGIHTRLDRAANAAFALAQVALSAGDRVAMLVYGRGVLQRIQPGRGSAHLRRMLDALATAASHPAEADHARAAAALMTAQKRRALIVWLTDVGETAAVPEVIESAAALVPLHVVLFAVMRPAELADLAAEAPVRERDLYRVMAAQEMTERRVLLLGQLRQRGALAVEVPSADLTAAVVDRYLSVKERGVL